MWLESAPEQLCQSRTNLIPKVKEPKTPADFRPIAVSLMILRVFHRILANRISGLDFYERRRAFRQADGCADNTTLLDFILRYHHKSHKKMYLVTLDMAKAFDTVSFHGLELAMAFAGIPREMRNYISDIYTENSTRIQHGYWTSPPIKPRRGVKQGDPLSLCYLIS